MKATTKQAGVRHNDETAIKSEEIEDMLYRVRDISGRQALIKAIVQYGDLHGFDVSHMSLFDVVWALFAANERAIESLEVELESMGRQGGAQ